MLSFVLARKHFCRFRWFIVPHCLAEVSYALTKRGANTSEATCAKYGEDDQQYQDEFPRPKCTHDTFLQHGSVTMSLRKSMLPLIAKKDSENGPQVRVFNRTYLLTQYGIPYAMIACMASPR